MPGGIVGDTILVLIASGIIHLTSSQYVFVRAWNLNGTGHYIAVDPKTNNVYANDKASVKKFSSDGSYITRWDTNLRSIDGIAVDSSGNVYVGDLLDHAVRKFGSDGNYITTWNSSLEARSTVLSSTGILLSISPLRNSTFVYP